MKHRSLGRRSTTTLFMLMLALVAPAGVDATAHDQPLRQSFPRFLYPPYPGSARATSIFDHNTPQNDGSPDDDFMITFNGYQTNECRDDPNLPTCYIPELDRAVLYNEHEGIDFIFNYRPVLAAADATGVAKAGWYVPNHSIGYGLMVRLRHNVDGRQAETLYGHLSSIAVMACPATVGACGIPPGIGISQGDVIGISGNTGNSGTPHLHFSVLNPANAVVGLWEQYMDPYGWQPDPEAPIQDDPWGQWEQSEPLWAVEPDIHEGPSILPSGEGNDLPYPPGPSAEASSIIDDYAHLWVDTSSPPPSVPNFEARNCWDRSTEKSGGQGAAYNSYNLSVLRRGASLGAGQKQGPCTARWLLPPERPSGEYAIYVHIPRSTSTYSESAPYTIVSNAALGQVLINQEQIRTGVHASAAGSDDETVDDGWLYIGRYKFVQGRANYVEVSNQTEEEKADTTIVADALQFVLIRSDIPPTPTPTLPPTRTPVPPGTLVQVQIDRSSDDAGQNFACAYSISHNEVYLGECDNGSPITSGFRFSPVSVPRNATITDAYIRFTVDGPYTGALDLSLHAEDTGNAQTFSLGSRPDMRPLLGMSVPWVIPASDRWELGETRLSPSLIPLVQAIVERSDWYSGNGIAIVVKNAGPASGELPVRRVVGYDRPVWYPGTEYAATLVIRYTGGIPVASPTPSQIPPPSVTPTPTRTPCLCAWTCVRSVAAAPFSSWAAGAASPLTRLWQVVDLTELLQRLRDEVMSQTEEGRLYTTLYETYSPELAEILLADETLRQDAIAAVGDFAPVFEALVEGRGGEVVITEEQVSAVQGLLDRISEAASLELSDVIARERARRSFDTIAGMTADQAWLFLNGYSLTWLPPLDADGEMVVQRGRTIPVRFKLLDIEGNPVLDPTVSVMVNSPLGYTLFGPIGMADNPSEGVVYQGNGVYHFNLPTDSLEPYFYELFVSHNAVSGVAGRLEFEVREK